MTMNVFRHKATYWKFKGGKKGGEPGGEYGEPQTIAVVWSHREALFNTEKGEEKMDRSGIYLSKSGVVGVGDMIAYGEVKGKPDEKNGAREIKALSEVSNLRNTRISTQVFLSVPATKQF